MSILTTSRQLVRPVSAGESAWQQELRSAVRDASKLCHLLELPAELAAAAQTGSAEFPIFVPPSYLARIQKGNPQDPLLRQVLPAAAEAEDVAGFTLDPVDDSAAEIHAGVLQKYQGRALLITTGVCAVHCRYCFRRHYPYEQAPHSPAAWQGALESIAADPSIHEVILSGGDPLMLVDSRLQNLISQITNIAHVNRLRIHTRLPIMIPSRVTPELVAMLQETRLKTVMVLHANHAQELDTAVADSLQTLQRARVMLLNQAVLLRGVNDSLQAQRDLSERLVATGVLPYYLHQLDRVAGAAHFEVPQAEGKRIIQQLRETLPGYMVPRYVQEIPGELHKTLLD